MKGLIKKIRQSFSRSKGSLDYSLNIDHSHDNPNKKDEAASRYSIPKNLREDGVYFIEYPIMVTNTYMTTNTYERIEYLLYDRREKFALGLLDQIAHPPKYLELYLSGKIVPGRNKIEGRNMRGARYFLAEDVTDLVSEEIRAKIAQYREQLTFVEEAEKIVSQKRNELADLFSSFKELSQPLSKGLIPEDKQN